MKEYSSDLKGFIENMRDLEKEASLKDERGILMLTSYARKMAEDFLAKCLDQERTKLR